VGLAEQWTTGSVCCRGFRVRQCCCELTVCSVCSVQCAVCSVLTTTTPPQMSINSPSSTPALPSLSSCSLSPPPPPSLFLLLFSLLLSFFFSFHSFFFFLPPLPPHHVRRRRQKAQPRLAAALNNDDDDTFSQRSYHGRFGFYHRHSKFLNHLLTFFICTGLFIPAVIIRKEGNVLVLSLLYAAVVWWLLLQHLPDGTLSWPFAFVWNGIAKVINMLPSIAVKVIGFGVPPVALILTAALRADDVHGTRVQRLISCLGLVVLILITVAFSKVIYRLLRSILVHDSLAITHVHTHTCTRVRVSSPFMATIRPRRAFSSLAKKGGSS